MMSKLTVPANERLGATNCSNAAASSACLFGWHCTFEANDDHRATSRDVLWSQ
ncbi:MAG: hypothetical protein JOZ99_11045 [Actinobacteria bacterium]|nr:hypothetical protein [Actinomycetota bacterium]